MINIISSTTTNKMTANATKKSAEKVVPQKRKMKPGGGKAKGSAFEGVIAKKLSSSLTPLNFIRTPGSGARVGGKNFETIGKMMGLDALNIFVGDVVPVNEKQESVQFLHSVECKFYKTPDNFNSLITQSANIFKWFDESVVDSAKVGKNPILIFKWNNMPIFVAAYKLPASKMTLHGEKYDIQINELDAILHFRDWWVK
jgi:hypothetical protein